MKNGSKEAVRQHNFRVVGGLRRGPQHFLGPQSSGSSIQGVQDTAQHNTSHAAFNPMPYMPYVATVIPSHIPCC